MLLMLGFNDMGWYWSDALGTLNSIQSLITNARAANPNLRFAIANVPMRVDLGRADLPAMTDQYNALLPDYISQWNTTESPVELVKLREGYSCELDGCPAGYDGLHPKAYGEYQIAHAFSQTLVNKFGLGKTSLAVPDIDSIPPRPMPVPTNFKVKSSPNGFIATWDPVFGAYSYDIQSRIQNTTDWVSGFVPSNRYDAIWTIEGAIYDIKVRVSCGDTQKGNWTHIGSAIARPQTAPAPENIVVTATSSGFDISFDPPSGAYTDCELEYQFLYFDMGVPMRFDCLKSISCAGSPVRVNGLVPGHRYFVAVSSWNTAGIGFPRFIDSVVVGRSQPSTLQYLDQIKIWPA